MEKFNGRCLDFVASEQPLAHSIGQFNGRAVPTFGYIAQLANPFKNMTGIELSTILKSLNLAGNSMTCEAAFMLQDFVGVSPIRPSIMMEASMIRAACKTFKDFDWTHTVLSRKAMDCFSLSSAFSNIIPPVWDSLAFCDNFYHASRLEGMRFAYSSKPASAKVIYGWRAGSPDLSLDPRLGLHFP